MEKLEGAIKSVVDGIFARVAEGNRVAFEGHAEREEIKKGVAALTSGDFGRYEYLVLHPLNQFTSGLAESVFPGSAKLQFLAREIAFFQRHLGETIKEIEGSSCYNDKTQRISRALLQFFLTGKEIAWDYSAEYTYSLPKKIFVTHEEIVEFFDAVHFLFYGRPDRYLAFREKLARFSTAAG